MRTVADFAEEKGELQALLASGIFNRAPNLEHVLAYVCQKYFEGAAGQIKEYNVAVEALGRPPGFDQKRDSIVRVEAHRLRKRLNEYYETEGAGHAIRIDIPSGQYAPRFVRQLPSQPVVVMDVTTDVTTDVTAPTPHPHPANGVPTSQSQAGPQEVVPVPNAVSFSPARPLLLAPPQNRAGTWIALVLAGLVVVGLLGWRFSAARPIKVAALPPAGAALNLSPETRILAGLQNGPYTDRFGSVWQSDRYFQGGSVFEAPAHSITGTRDARLFRSRREGAFSYDIPLAPGVYELRLYFAETLYGENNMAGGGETSRIFSISANGAPLLSDFDVIGEVGPSAADIRAFKDISPAADGKLHLKFDPQTNPAIVSAIEISPGTRGKLRPIRVVSRDHPYTDKQGRTWAADSYSRGGQLVMRTEPVANIDDPEMLHGERYGNLSYSIPVPPGRYAITLYFAEAWFGPGNFAGGGTGSRLFDILCNGVALRRAFDIFKEAHGSDRAVLFTIHNQEPNPQGKIAISLAPIRNYASLNALEVIDESSASSW